MRGRFCCILNGYYIRKTTLVRSRRAATEMTIPVTCRRVAGASLKLQIPAPICPPPPKPYREYSRAAVKNNSARNSSVTGRFRSSPDTYSQTGFIDSKPEQRIDY